MKTAGFSCSPQISLGQQWQKKEKGGLKISLLNQEAGKFFSWENNPYYDALGIMNICMVKGILESPASISHILGSWRWSRKGSLAFRPNLRLPLYFPHSLYVNTSSICLKRIISLGCRTGSTSPSDPTVSGHSWTWVNQLSQWRRARLHCIPASYPCSFFLPAYSHGYPLEYMRVIYRLASGNILEGETPRRKLPSTSHPSLKLSVSVPN